MSDGSLPPTPRVTSDGDAAVIPAGPKLDASGKLDEDHACVRCGYQLRGLPLAGACPECGCEVLRSFAGDLLRFSDPGHVASLHRGCVAVLAGVAMQIASTTGTIAVDHLMHGGGLAVDLITAFLSLLAFTSQVVSLWGYWTLSRPDPAQQASGGGSVARRLLRLAMAAHVVCMVLTIVFEMLPQLGPNSAAATFARTAGRMVWVAQFFAVLTYVGWLAGRIPSKAIRDRAGVLRWLIPVLGIVGVCTYGATIVAACVLYYLLFDAVRRALKDLRWPRGEEAPGVAGGSGEVTR